MNDLFVRGELSIVNDEIRSSTLYYSSLDHLYQFLIFKSFDAIHQYISCILFTSN